MLINKALLTAAAALLLAGCGQPSEVKLLYCLGYKDGVSLDGRYITQRGDEVLYTEKEIPEMRKTEEAFRAEVQKRMTAPGMSPAQYAADVDAFSMSRMLNEALELAARKGQSDLVRTGVHDGLKARRGNDYDGVAKAMTECIEAYQAATK